MEQEGQLIGFSPSKIVDQVEKETPEQGSQSTSPPVTTTVTLTESHGAITKRSSHVAALAQKFENVVPTTKQATTIDSMKAQHKTLPDGTGAGKGWVLAQSMNKLLYMMGKQGQ